MESLTLNILTVGLTSCLLQLLLRFVLKRPLSKVIAIIVIVVNTLLMIVLWVALRGLLLTGDYDRQPPGGDYITYGVGIAAFISWGILTSLPNSDKKNSESA